MIEGIVSEYQEALVNLTVRGPTGEEAAFDFLVDTGFTGAVSLHSSVAAALELPTLGAEVAMLADGSVITYSVSEAVVVWDGVPRRVPVSIADNIPLLGMRMLAGHELLIHDIPDGLVRISPLPMWDGGTR
jgi:clan AA aspartic protease